MSPTTWVSRLGAAALAVVVLAGCGGQTPTTEDVKDAVSSAMPSAADVLFVQMMIPHHEQAVEMSAWAADRAADPRVTELAEAIEGAQQPEIDLMTGWLDDWGMPAMTDHTGHVMPGMLSDEQLAELESAAGEAFDRLYLQLMIAHHQGALEMAQPVLENGRDPDVRALVEGIVEVQQDEIDQMKQLLDELP